MTNSTTTAQTPRCPECGKGALRRHLIDERFAFDLGDEPITVTAHNVPVERCDHCEFAMSGPEAAKIRHDAVCRAAGFFTPEAIKALRQRLGLSQGQFARLAGVGVATISRWERGRVLQNRSNDHLLYLIAESDEARRLLEGRLAARNRGRTDDPPAPGQASSPSPVAAPRSGRFRTNVAQDPALRERSRAFDLCAAAACSTN
jgi:putative zinc finger/helix-turn-helix YgiT family protein